MVSMPIWAQCLLALGLFIFLTMAPVWLVLLRKFVLWKHNPFVKACHWYMSFILRIANHIDEHSSEEQER